MLVCFIICVYISRDTNVIFHLNKWILMGTMKELISELLANHDAIEAPIQDTNT